MLHDLMIKYNNKILNSWTKINENNEKLNHLKEKLSKVTYPSFEYAETRNLIDNLYEETTMIIHDVNIYEAFVKDLKQKEEELHCL